MQSIREGIEAAIAYIEGHLTEELDVHDIAARAYVSAFHFQRIFIALCGMPLDGEFGVCIDADGNEFDYLIADRYQPGQSIPEGCITRDIPGGMWAVFPCTLATLQDVNTKMWRDRLPACREYRLSHNCNLEFYYPLNQDDLPASKAELWLPIVPA